MGAIINEVKEHCQKLLTQSRCSVLPFHSVQHTLEVFENVQTIAHYEKLSAEETEVLEIAALFHDTGISSTYSGHEEISANNAHLFLSELGYAPKLIAEVMNCIKATQMPQRPKTQLERIICDADLFHLSSKEYILKNELLRLEWKTHMNCIFADHDWYRLNFDFLLNHHYHTEYGRLMLEEEKQKNIALMQKLKDESCD
ncbi:HD domain-containing protein [Sediminibacter sp. Hel_I_10]|uniref:HD domain-containing protein n=1 Tax=Sediminibacter sp. Hel_I_10 TaxID=1392490 RepID=UPI0005602A15|nr:HD domain-containing protein [Sediminibacter sp. Hel_I_10]